MGRPPLPGCALPADWADVLARVEAALAGAVSTVERLHEPEGVADPNHSADIAGRLEALQRRLAEFQACAAAAERGVLEVDALLARQSETTAETLGKAADVSRRLTEWAGGSLS